MFSTLSDVKNETLIDKVVAEAEKGFVDGHTKYKEFKESIKKNPSLRHKIRPEMKRGNFFQYKDDNFISYDANQIEGTNFIAAAGPAGPDVCDFLKSIAFNDRLEIQEIVAIGAELGNEYCEGYQDFCDYITESNMYVGNNSDLLFVEVDHISGKFDKKARCHPQTIVQSQLTLKLFDGEIFSLEPIRTKQVNVTLYPLEDGRSIKLSERGPGPELEKTLHVLWEIYQKSLNEYIVVHCASGLGRTGHLILLFELLKHYDEIFASQDPVIIAKEIHKVLERIRKNRPSLILGVEQFKYAILNTEVMHRYDLRMRSMKKVDDDKTQRLIPPDSPRDLPLFSDFSLFSHEIGPLSTVEKCENPVVNKAS